MTGGLIDKIRDYYDRQRKAIDGIDDIPVATNTNYQNAITFVPRDPLAIDLTGDGIKTAAINPSAPLLFDHNGDGTRTASGWLDSSDAWLVRDVGNDGLIKSGKELFGVDTDITVGGVLRKATSGFEALAALDANGDKVFDAKDAAFAGLRLWQDKNQNGVSEAGELSTLSAKGIVSIALNYTSANADLGNGNAVTGKAVVTRSTGTSEIDSVRVTGDSAAYNLNLADNPFYSSIPATPVNATAKALPDMHGSGLVQDLRQAMSLGTASANTLTATVTQFAKATTRDAQMALIDQLVQQWGATSKLTTSNPFVSGATIEFTIPNPNDPTAVKIQTFAQQNPALYRKVIALEQFNGTTGLSQLMTRWGASIPTNVVTLLDNAYAALRDSVYGALAMQTRLKPYFDAISLVVDDKGIRFDTSGLDALLETRKAANAKNALIDLVELNKFSSETLDAVGFDRDATLGRWLGDLPADSPLRASVIGYSSALTSGNDIVFAGAAEDQLSGGQGNDLIWAGLGNDVVWGNDGADHLLGDGGSDTLYGGSGNDTMTGGTGNDYFEGDIGNDVYEFSKGDGVDAIYAQFL